MSQATLSGTYYNSNLFSNYYLDERVYDLAAWDCDEQAAAALEELRELWAVEQRGVEGYNEDTLLGQWIDEVLSVLGYDVLQETALHDSGGYVDRLLFGSSDDRIEATERQSAGDLEAMYGRSLGVLEAKRWDADFEKRFHEDRQYRDASHQIKYYLERTPDTVQWGILTDGRKWRLYGTKDYETGTYYEVDLPELLERGDTEAFKRFFVFFRAAAFRESAGTTLLDTVWSESEAAAEDLGEDLQDNVFTALRVLGRGFVETNDLDIDPDDEAALSELKEQSLVLLYRLMFVLYAEARGLIDPEAPGARDEYRENFSLDQIRRDVFEEIDSAEEFDLEFSRHATTLWSRLDDLFGLVDTGNADLGIPPYNGGLFDREEHAFLDEHEVADRYLAEVIYRISTTGSEQTDETVLADYADLDTRHLGSIYEGLLEHQFRIAGEDLAAVREDGGQTWKPAAEVSVADAVETVDRGGFYVVNDEGERKATGAYYTPDYVVTYIVEETVDPLLEEIHEDLDAQGVERGTPKYFALFRDRVTDLKILDPAMGSGHFLTKATGYLADAIMAEARELETGGMYDEQRVRRDVSKECIYGVDLNPMAVELAKLSMWLETLAADQPLAFLDHHLKCGNSLVGSDIEEIEGLESDSNGDDEQASLAEFGATREGTIERLMEIYQEFLAIENEDIEDVKAMERKYAQIQEDDLRQRLVAMANVRTAEDFGLDVSTEGDRNPYEWMASALESDEEWAEVAKRDWFESAQAMAEEENFFHWKLEFPEVFYHQSGNPKQAPGFDGIVGNPPWLRFQKIPDGQRMYQRNVFSSAKSKYDIYCTFIEKSIGLLHTSGKFGYIIPNRFLAADYGEYIKQVIKDRSSVKAILDFEDARIFKGTTTYPLILLLDQESQKKFSYAHLYDATDADVRSLLLNGENQITPIPADRLDPSISWIFPNKEEQEVIESLREGTTDTADLLEISKSVSTGLKEAFLFSADTPSEIPIENELLRPVVDGADVDRYSPVDIGKYLLFPYVTDEYGELSLVDLDRFPLAKEHLLNYEEDLRGRRYYNKSLEEAGLAWYEFPHIKENHHLQKVIFPDISTHPRSTFDSDGAVRTLTTAYGGICNSIDLDVRYLCSLFNSSALRLIFELISPQMSGGYYRYQPQYIGQLPIYVPEKVPQTDSFSSDWVSIYDTWFQSSDYSFESLTDSESYEFLCWLAEQMRSYVKNKEKVNLHLPDYLGNYTEGPTLADLPSIPPEGLAESLLTATESGTDRFETIRATDVEIARDGDRLTLSLVPYVKPTESVRDEYETNSHDYATLDPIPAMVFHDLDPAQADLIEAFVPHAVGEAGGYAGFRDGATKTISLLDRLESLTLPAIEDVRDGLEDYRKAVERAEELDEKIERTDALIDEIVYELYGLTDEEIEIVEEAVGD